MNTAYQGQRTSIQNAVQRNVPDDWQADLTPAQRTDIQTRMDDNGFTKKPSKPLPQEVWDSFAKQGLGPETILQPSPVAGQNGVLRIDYRLPDSERVILSDLGPIGFVVHVEWDELDQPRRSLAVNPAMEVSGEYLIQAETVKAKEVLTPLIQLLYRKFFTKFLGITEVSPTWWGRILDRYDMEFNNGGDLWKALQPWEIGPETDLSEVIFTPRKLVLDPQDQQLHYGPTANVKEQKHLFAFPGDPLGRPIVQKDGKTSLDLRWMEGQGDASPLRKKIVPKLLIEGGKIFKRDLPLSEQNPPIGFSPGILTLDGDRVGELAAFEKTDTIRGVKGAWYVFENAANFRERQFVDVHGRLLAIESDRLFSYLRQVWKYTVLGENAGESREVLVMDPSASYFKPMYSVTYQGWEAYRAGDMAKVEHFKLKRVVRISPTPVKTEKPFSASFCKCAITPDIPGPS